jgi:hypothetical protein
MNLLGDAYLSGQNQFNSLARFSVPIDTGAKLLRDRHRQGQVGLRETGHRRRHRTRSVFSNARGSSPMAVIRKGIILA